jgi:LysR family transcriptional regulator for metE and metH
MKIMSNAHETPMLPVTSLETRDLRLVHAIASSGSATRAASLLHVSQSAVSHQLKNLEERLGVPLFERRGRTLRFTAAGERFLSVANQVLEPLAKLELELKTERAPRVLPLRVATQCYTAYHWLPRVLADFRLLHPNVQLRILPDRGNESQIALSAGELDLVLHIGAMKHKTLLHKKLFHDELVLVTAADHRLAKKAIVCAEDLKTETLILFDTVMSERERVKKKLFPRGGGFANVMRVPLTDAAVELVKAGLGVSILAGWAVASHVAKGELSRIRITRAGLKREWYGVYQRGSLLVPAIESLLGLIRARSLPPK